MSAPNAHWLNALVLNDHNGYHSDFTANEKPCVSKSPGPCSVDADQYGGLIADSS